MGMWICLHDPLTPVWKYSLLQVFSAGQFQKGLESFPSQYPASQVWSSINCHTHGHKCYGLGEPGTDEIPFHDKEIVPQGVLESPFGALILDLWEGPSGNQSVCFQLGSGKSTIVVRTCWYTKKSSRVCLLSNCQSSKWNSLLHRLRFKWNAYMYTFGRAYCLCLRYSVFIYKIVLPGPFLFFAKMDWRKNIYFLFSTLRIWKDLTKTKTYTTSLM